jgi:AraC-like DNA-binding protein
MSSSNLTWNETFINQMVQILEENISNSDFSVQELSNKLKMSQTTLFRKVKILTGHSPIEFMMLFKMQKAYKLLSTSESIRSVAKMVGFNNSSYFSKCFRKQFDATPMAFRQKYPLRINSGNLKVSDKIYYSV